MKRTIEIKEQNRRNTVLRILTIVGIFTTVLISVFLLLEGLTSNNVKDVVAKEIEGTSIKCEVIQTNRTDVVESFSKNKKWFLLGPQFTQIDQTLILTLYIDPNISLDDPEVTYSIGDNEGNFAKITETKYEAEVSVKDFESGTYEINANIKDKCMNVSTEKVQFNVSYPVYVTWTQDWEGTEIKDQYLNEMEQISSDHGIPMTHFFNPRIYVTNAVSPQRAQYFTEWVLRRQRDYGDDIGLHLHMFPDMIAAAGVEPRSDATNWGQNRNDGYDVLTSEYSQQEMEKMMLWSKQIFVEKGLGDPVMYRAGGWFANEDTLKAAEATGFVMDSSGRTEYTLGNNNISGHWSLMSTTQPYQMNSYDQNITDRPNMDLWEFPNNGGDSWAYSSDEMIQRFRDNYDGTTQEDKKVVTYVSHPHWFYEDKPKLEVLFTEIDKSIYTEDNGPVIYTTLSEAYRIWSLSDGNN